MGVDNAHIRQPGRDPGVAASDADRALNDPALVTAFNDVRDFLVDKLENLEIDGTPETAEVEHQLCVSLRSLNGVKRALALRVQKQQLRLADFTGKPNEDDDGT